MKISFTDFWPGFRSNSNFFIDVLRSSFSGIKLVSPQKADVIFHSVFGEKYKNFNSLRILYTGENISFKKYDSDYALSFEDSTDDLKNFRLPLWMLQLRWFNKHNHGNPNFLCEIDSLMNPFPNSKERPIFLSSIFNHDNAENRLATISKLMKMGKTRFFGVPFGNHFSGERKKIRILTNSKFNLCFENSDTYGYHTEKLIHAKYAGSVPIYWANSQSLKKDFNINSFLYLNNPRNSLEIAELIDRMESKAYLNKVLSEPLFNSSPTLDPLIDHFAKILKF
jgi:hypothetical protein